MVGQDFSDRYSEFREVYKIHINKFLLLKITFAGNWFTKEWVIFAALRWNLVLKPIPPTS
jgi:hypothetical protein